MKTLRPHDLDMKSPEELGKWAFLLVSSYPNLSPEMKAEFRDALKEVINAGADMSYVDLWGRGILHPAVENLIDPDIIVLLIEAGCRLDMISKRGSLLWVLCDLDHERNKAWESILSILLRSGIGILGTLNGIAKGYIFNRHSKWDLESIIAGSENNPELKVFYDSIYQNPMLIKDDMLRCLMYCRHKYSVKVG